MPVTFTAPGDTTAPGVPTNPAASQGQGKFSRFTWDGGAEADFREFIVEKSTDGGSTWTQVHTGNSQEYLDDDVAWGSTYHYRVAARDRSLNPSAFTSAVSTTITQDDLVVGSPGGATSPGDGNFEQVKESGKRIPYVDSTSDLKADEQLKYKVIHVTVLSGNFFGSAAHGISSAYSNHRVLRVDVGRFYSSTLRFGTALETSLVSSVPYQASVDDTTVGVYTNDNVGSDENYYCFIT